MSGRPPFPIDASDKDKFQITLRRRVTAIAEELTKLRGLVRYSRFYENDDLIDDLEKSLQGAVSRTIAALREPTRAKKLERELNESGGGTN